ncbi:MAG TPA: hypothetical protein VKE70_07675 [Candidatus Solibacter sp.]|nr:hypothetical protein [Candidatus Solibacter sp.]
MTKPRVLFPLLFAALLAARLCHSGILWAEESLPLAAAQQMRFGRTLYRDIWFDKPPLLALVHLPFTYGPILRIAGALYCLLACWIVYRFARDLWSGREAAIAAALLAFFLIFAIPSAVTPLASDLLMLAPHVAAVWMASRGRSLLAGALAGIAFWVSPKGLLVLLACAVWNPALLLFAGFAAIFAVGAIAVPAAYWEQVWIWGRIYAGSGFPLSNGAIRTLNWCGFHIACIPALVTREIRSLKWILWLAISFAGVVAGMRFFPRYFFQLLPVVVLLAARGYTQIAPRWRWAGVLLLIPLVRFAPTYIYALHPETWRDTAMDQDSRAAAVKLPGASLFVWGYRPEIYVYSGLPAASRFLDSQPLTGVPADRHLTESAPVETEQSRANRTGLVLTHPTIVVDGLGAYNPKLAPAAYPDLLPWLANYQETARTPQSIIYQLRVSAPPRQDSLPRPARLPLP